MKIRIEMEVPNDMDPSDILARMQELTVEFADEFADDEDDEDLVATRHEGLQDMVSVEVLPEVVTK